jgi:hypothetical protein
MSMHPVLLFLALAACEAAPVVIRPPRGPR